MSDEHIFKLDVSDQLAGAVGQMTLYFGHLDWEVKMLIIKMLECPPQQAQMVVSLLSFRDQLNMMVWLYQRREDKPVELDRLKELRKSIEKIEERRNEITHGMLIPAGDEILSGMKLRRHKPGGKFLRETIESLEELNGEMQSAVGQLMYLSFQIAPAGWPVAKSQQTD